LQSSSSESDDNYSNNNIAPYKEISYEIYEAISNESIPEKKIFRRD
jgi:hypothetical protein